MPVVADLFKETKPTSKVVPELFGQTENQEIPKPSIVPNLFGKEKPKTSFLQESLIKPIKTFYGGTLKASANAADTLDFYSDKISKVLNIPETKNSIFEILRDNWNFYGDKLQKEGLSEGVVKKIYSGLGEAGFEVPKLMALGPGALITSGIAEGGKTGGVKGAVMGGLEGALNQGMLKGLNTLPVKVKLPTAFGAGAITTPGGLEEKVAGGTVLTGLSMGGKSPTIKEFKENQLKYSPLVKGYQKVLPFERREEIYQNYVNRMQSIENITEKAKSLGAKILPGEDPALRARTYLGIGQKVKTVLEDQTYKINPDGTFTYTGEGLKPILDNYDKVSIEKNRVIRDKDLNDYLIATRIIRDLQRPKSEWTQENIVTPEQIKKAQETIDGLNIKYKGNIQHLEHTATRLYDYQKRVSSMLVDSGNMSQAQYNDMLAKNPHYIPFDRVIESVDTAGTPVSKNRFTGARSPIKRIKGSELEIHNPIESIIKNTYRIMDIAERNTVARNVAKLTDILPEDVSPVKIKMVPVAEITHKAAVDAGYLRQVKEFAEKLGARVITGGQPGRALGYYYPAGRVVERKFTTPEEVVSHEVGHFLDDKFKLKSKFYARGESKKVGQEIKQFMIDQGQSANRVGKVSERFAHAFEWWLSNRALAQKDLPLFSESIGKIINDIPDLKPLLDIRPTPGLSIESMKETIFGQSQFKPKGNVIEYFNNGKRSYIEVTPNLYQAMTGLNETSTSILTKIMSIPAGTLRTGATITPEFMLRNPIRDQWTALMQTKLGFKPFVDTGGAIADIMGKSKAYNDWLRSGGAYSGFVELSRPNLQKQLNILKGNSSLLSKLNIITKAQDISQLFEQATRLGIYKAAVKKGLTPIEAGFESRESTLDFARRGAKTRDINSVIAFFNAGIQGTDKFVRTAKEDPAGFAVKGIASITIPSLITYTLNRKDPEYKELPRWQKDLFWIFKVNNTWVRIPKPFSYGQVFGSLPERFMEYLDSNDPKAFDNIGKTLYDSLTPSSGDPTGGLMATGVKPLIENATNWNFFRQAPIVSQGKQRLLPEKQFGRYTSETAKYVGKIINYSPAKIENLVTGWFGGSGMYALQTLDLAGKGIVKVGGGKTIPKRPIELTDIPLIKGFIVRSPESGSSESANQFYDDKDKITQIYSTIKQYYQAKDKQSAEKLKLQHPEYRAYQGINKTAQTLADLSSYSDYIVNSDKPEDVKRELLKKTKKQQLEIIQKANRAIEKFKKPKNKVVQNLF